ncbi:MAG: ATP-binding protein [Gaiellaceae bacterium]
MRRLSLVGRVVALASTVAALVIVIVAAALLAIVSLRRAEARESRAKDVTAATLRTQNMAVGVESSLRGYILSGNSRFLTLFNNGRDALPGSLRRLETLVRDDPKQLRRVRAVDEALKLYVSDYAEPVIAIRGYSPAVARGKVVGAEDKRRSLEIRTLLGSILADESRQSAARAANARAVANGSVVVGVIALAFSAALVLLFGAWVARAVAAPVRRIASAAAQVAGGDFDVRVEQRGSGEVGDLVSAFNSMTRSLELGRLELLEQNERLRESEQHKRDLISMVSHEIRTPLAAVVGFTSLLLEREFPQEEQRRYLDIIDQQARRLAALAGDFLDVQLLEGGSLTLEREEFDLVELAEEQGKLFFSHSSTHTLDVDVPDEPAIVNGDRDRIAQVIGNLLSNAIKYSPDGRRVRMAVRVVEGRAQVEISDEGMGIPEADRQRVFEKFYRVPGAASAVGGTGLGLAVARELVLSHGGAIDMESQFGHGSTFTVTLPLATASVSA